MKNIIPYLKPYRLKIVIGILLVALSTVCELMLPTLMSSILNEGVRNADLDYIYRCCFEMLAVALISLGAVFGGNYISSMIVAGFSADLRAGIFHKANSLSFEELGAIGSSALLTRATHDVGTLSWVASMLSGSVITIPVLFFGGNILAMRKDFMLSLVLLVFLPMVFIVVMKVGRKVEPLWVESDRYIDRQNDIIRERLHGIRVIRAFNNEPHEQERAAEATRIMADNIIKSNIAMGIVAPLATGLMNIAIVIITYLGAFRIEKGIGSLTGGDVFAIIQYIVLVMNGVVMAAFSIVMLPHAKVAARRVGEVLDAKGIDDGSGDSTAAFSGDIVMENVTFRYEGADLPAVSDVSLHIAKGENVAFIGGTGSGKSTLVQLLISFRIPVSGRVIYDGADTSELSRRAVRDNISCVLQKNSIYSGTVRRNLVMGNPDADDETIHTALEAACIDDFVRSLPEGLDYELHESGKNLSGGQKQRICIARALLKNAPIYIFDDSFSALDFITEAKVRRALRETLGDRTRITVTQRVSSAMNCDRIYVMDAGRLVDSGTHTELLERCTIYREIYLSQTGGERHE